MDLASKGFKTKLLLSNLQNRPGVLSMDPGCQNMYSMLLFLVLLILTSFATVISELNLKCVSLDLLDVGDELDDLGGLDGHSW